MNFKDVASAFFSVTVLLSAAGIITAQSPGSLDPTFGDGNGIAAQFYRGDSVSGAIQSDGKILQLYQATATGNKLIRRAADGSPDLSFDGDGTLLFVWPSSDGSVGWPKSIALQTDAGVEKIIVAGWTKTLLRNKAVEAFRVDRYLPDGSVDTSFGSGGSVTYQSESGTAVAIQPGAQPTDPQKILVLSSTRIVRLNANGTLDTAFGSGGTANYSSILTSGRALAVQPDGKVVVAGLFTSKNKTNMAAARFNRDGSVDSGFGSSGRTVLTFGSTESQGGAIVLAPGGTIVISGGVGGLTGGDVAIARLDTNGNPDPSFNFDGKATYDFGGTESGSGLALQSDGKIITGGSSKIGTQDSDFSMVRFDTAGNVDTTFGSGGAVITDIFGDGDYAKQILVQFAGTSAERIVMLGASYSDSGSNLWAVAARYLE